MSSIENSNLKLSVCIFTISSRKQRILPVGWHIWRGCFDLIWCRTGLIPDTYTHTHTEKHISSLRVNVFGFLLLLRFPAYSVWGVESFNSIKNHYHWIILYTLQHWLIDTFSIVTCLTEYNSKSIQVMYWKWDFYRI